MDTSMLSEELRATTLMCGNFCVCVEDCNVECVCVCVCVQVVIKHMYLRQKGNGGRHLRLHRCRNFATRIVPVPIPVVPAAPVSAAVAPAGPLLLALTPRRRRLLASALALALAPAVLAPATVAGAPVSSVAPVAFTLLARRPALTPGVRYTHALPVQLAAPPGRRLKVLRDAACCLSRLCAGGTKVATRKKRERVPSNIPPPQRSAPAVRPPSPARR